MGATFAHFLRRDERAPQRPVGVGGRSPPSPLRGYPAMPTPQKKSREAPTGARRVEKGRLLRVKTLSNATGRNVGWHCGVAAQRRGPRGAQRRCSREATWRQGLV